MHWFVTDETNNDFVEDKFFIYGGLVLDDEQFLKLTERVGEIRAKYGYTRGDSFKFHTRSRPTQVTIDDSKAAKRELVESLEEFDVKMIAYLILHNIAKGVTDQVRMNWALNTVTWAYHRFLEREGATGVMMMDRADEQHIHLAELFQHGIDVEGKRVAVDDRINFFGMTSDNASHISSAVDIALGGFRYCVNAAGGDGSQVVAAEIFPPLARTLWGVEVAGTKYLRNYGFHPMPKTEIKSYRYRGLYTDLYRELDGFTGSDSETDAA
ncbi:hypothetical protein [Agromyces bauzanensis]|uniref:DUF3800 domain-containing protein n=1 Tax=Agromyces bauzanensis TaxID=1308924 RepID=A0A917USY5_9MICO|nr:hypothetical protein [Agromyces bauzanensis]GGJ83113.1 hypothetical protein GCM10011372_21780 [Agromyces bauzanensis]